LYQQSQLHAAFCFYTADPPQVITHPKESKDAVPGQPATFTVQVTGTQPLSYQWQWKPSGDEEGDEEWQQCDKEWCDGTTLKIPSVQKLNEGSYQCVITNCAGSQISTAAKLTTGKNPDNSRMCQVCSICILFYNYYFHTADPARIHTHPSELKNVIPGQPATFTVEATGTETLSYQWQWKPAGEEGGSEEWQPCKMEWSDDNALKIPSAQKWNEGSYQCVVSNCAGTQISTAAKLSISKF